MRQIVKTYALIQLLLLLVVSTALAQVDEKPTYSDTTRTDTKKVPGSPAAEEKSSLEIDNLVIYGTRNTVDQSEKEMMNPPDILSAPRVIPTSPDKGVQAIQQTLGQKPGLEQGEDGQMRRYLYRFSAEFGTYATIPLDLFHGNQIDPLNYFVNLRYERSDGHVDNSGYAEGAIEGRLIYQLDDTSSLALNASFYENPYDMYGRSSNLLLERDRRFRMIDGNVDLTKNLTPDMTFRAGMSANKAYLLDREYEEFENWEDSETSITSRLALNGLWNQNLVALDAAFSRTTTDYHNDVSYGMNYFKIQPKWTLRPLPAISTTIGATVLGYDADILGQKSQLLPFVRAVYQTPQGLVLAATFDSNVRGHSLVSYWQENAFIDSSYTPIPEYQPIDVEVVADYEVSSELRTQLGLNITQIRTLPLFDRRINEDGSDGTTYTWAVVEADSLLGIDSVTRNAIFAEATLIPAPSLQLSVNVTLQDFSDYLAYKPAFNAGFVADFRSETYLDARLSFNIIGERYVQNAKSNQDEPLTLDSYQKINVDLSRRVYKNITAIARAHNLLDADTDIWEDYEQRGRMFFVGAMIEF